MYGHTFFEELLCQFGTYGVMAFSYFWIFKVG